MYTEIKKSNGILGYTCTHTHTHTHTRTTDVKDFRGYGSLTGLVLMRDRQKALIIFHSAALLLKKFVIITIFIGSKHLIFR